MADLRQTVWGLAQAVEWLPPEDQKELRFDSIDNALVIAELPKLEDLDIARAHTVTAGTSIGKVKEWEHGLIRDRIIDMGGRGVRLGETWYRVERPSRWQVMDMHALCKWIETNAAEQKESIYHAVEAIWPANSARVTGLRNTAERWGLDPRTAVDTFMSKEPYREEEQVTAMPLSKAPKFAQRLDHGELWGKGSG